MFLTLHKFTDKSLKFAVHRFWCFGLEGFWMDHYVQTHITDPDCYTNATDNTRDYLRKQFFSVENWKNSSKIDFSLFSNLLF